MKQEAIGALRRDSRRTWRRPHEASPARPDRDVLLHPRSSRGTSRSPNPRCSNVTLHAYVFLVGGLLMLGVVAAAGAPRPPQAPVGARRSARARGSAARSRCRSSRSSSVRSRSRRRRPTTCTIACCRICARSRRCDSRAAARTPTGRRSGRWWDLLRPGPAAPRRPVRQGDQRDRPARARRRPCEDVRDGDGAHRSRPPLGAHPRRGREARSSASVTRSSWCCSACSPTVTC